MQMTDAGARPCANDNPPEDRIALRARMDVVRECLRIAGGGAPPTSAGGLRAFLVYLAARAVVALEDHDRREWKRWAAHAREVT